MGKARTFTYLNRALLERIQSYSYHR